MRRRQRLGIGAVAVARPARRCRAASRRRSACPRAPASAPARRRRPQAASAERIVAAGVEDDEVELRARALHLAQHQIDIHHLKIDIGLARRVGVDRHQIIRAAHLDAVTGVIEQRDIRSLDLLAEILDGVVDCGLVEIELRAAADQREAELRSVSAISLASFRGLSSRATFW